MTTHTDPLAIKRYPATKASELLNDSATVEGESTADALDSLKSEIDALGEGNVTADQPTTVGDVPFWDDDEGKLSSSSSIAVHPASSNKIEFKRGSFKALNTAADGATVTFDLDQADLWQVTLGGNRTLAYTHASVGQVIAIRLIQDATGGRTVTWWSNILWNHQVAPILDPTPNGTDVIVLECVGQDGYGVPIWEEWCRKSSAPRKSLFADTDGATITFDLRKSPMHKVTLGGNRTLAVIEAYRNQPFSVRLTQDGTGSRTVTWWSGITWAGGVPTLSTAAGKTDWFGFVVTSIGTYEGFVIGQGL